MGPDRGEGAWEAEDPAQAASPFWFDRPAQRWEEAVPLGNGRLGAMVHGGTVQERVDLNLDTLWSGAPQDWDVPAARHLVPAARQAVLEGRHADAEDLLRGTQGPYTQAFLPLGAVSLTFDHAAGVDDGSYRRALDLDSGTASVSYEVGGRAHRREAFVSAVADALVLRVTTARPRSLALDVVLDSPLRSRVTDTGPRRAALVGKAPAHVDPPYLDTPRPVAYDDRLGHGMHFAAAAHVVLDGPGHVVPVAGGLRVTGATALTLLLTGSTGFRGFDRLPDRTEAECLADAERRLDGLVDRSYEALREEHAREHRSSYRRAHLDLGAPTTSTLPLDGRLRLVGRDDAEVAALSALAFDYGRYLMLASSRPGTQPANLQGLWNNSVRPPWSSNYTLNINTEMNYWPAEPAGLPECHEPLLRLVSELAVTGRRTADRAYGCPGWVAHHNTDLWRHSSAVGAGSGDPSWANWWMGGAWLCHHLWEHYAFGLDEAFLRSAYPVMAGAAEFCLSWLVEDADGHLVTAPSTSPENLFLTDDGTAASVDVATTMDLAVIAQLFTDCLRAAAVLGIEDGLVATIEASLARLRPLRVGTSGRLLEWSRDHPEVDPHHRHLSHLFPIFPGDRVDPTREPALAAAARRSLEGRGDAATGWSLAWKAVLWARLRDGDRAYRLLREFLTVVDTTDVSVEHGGVYPNLLCAHPPFQIDGNFGVTAAVTEMLLQSHAEELHLLPALPAAWATGSVSGLRGRGGHVVSMSWRGGRLTSAVIVASRTGVCRVRLGDVTVDLQTVAGTGHVLDGNLRPVGTDRADIPDERTT